MTNLARRNRWAMSLADLLLLLLAFFVLLQASDRGKRDAMMSVIRQEFGGKADMNPIELKASELFPAGEAFLSAEGKARLEQLIATRSQTGKIELRSYGTDAALGRFDGWDLAAARLASVARALSVMEGQKTQIIIRGLDQNDQQNGKGQIISVVSQPYAVKK